MTSSAVDEAASSTKLCDGVAAAAVADGATDGAEAV